MSTTSMADRVVRPPPGHACTSQQLHHQPFGLRASTACCGDEQSARRLRTVAAAVASVCVLQHCQIDEALRRGVTMAGPPRGRTAASRTVRGSAVTCSPRCSTMSPSARSRRRSRMPSGARQWLVRGTVTSTGSGAIVIRPCHHAQQVRLPSLAAAAPHRGADPRGRGERPVISEIDTQCTTPPLAGANLTANRILAKTAFRACASVMTPSWRRR